MCEEFIVAKIFYIITKSIEFSKISFQKISVIFKFIVRKLSTFCEIVCEYLIIIAIEIFDRIFNFLYFYILLKLVYALIWIYKFVLRSIKKGYRFLEEIYLFVKEK